jgi:hypothetical protein
LNAPIDFFEDAATEENAPPATLERLTELARQTLILNAEIDELNIKLAEKQDKVKRNLRVIIPGIMDELGMAKFTLKDGYVIDVKNNVSASISEYNKPAAFAWLTEHGFDGIIKTNVAAQFGKGEVEEARKAVELLGEAGFSASMDQSVHPGTLKAFVKERLENAAEEIGNNIPVDVFGVFEFTEAKITAPKLKKPKK